MSNLRTAFDKALAVVDPVERAQALSDVAFDAEQMATSGCRAEAVEVFKLLATLDRSDDLLLPAIESAEQHLESLGARQSNRRLRLVLSSGILDVTRRAQARRSPTMNAP